MAGLAKKKTGQNLELNNKSKFVCNNANSNALTADLHYSDVPMIRTETASHHWQTGKTADFVYPFALIGMSHILYSAMFLGTDASQI